MKRRFATVLLAFVVVVAGCSGGSSSSKSSSSSTGGSSNAGSSSSGGGNATATAADCAAAGEALASAGDLGSSESFGSLRDQAFKARDSLRALQNAVSDSDTKNALKVLADAYNDFGNAVGDAKFDPSKGGTPPPEVLTAIQVFTKPEFGAAAAKLGQYFSNGCK